MTNNRTYYYDIYGKMEPDYESMAAYLLEREFDYSFDSVRREYILN